MRFLPGGGSRTQAWSAPHPPESPGLGAAPACPSSGDPAQASGTKPPGVAHSCLLGGGTRGLVSIYYSTVSGRELDSSRKAWSPALKLSRENGPWRGSRARGPPSGAAGDGRRGSPRGPHAGHAGHQLLRGDFQAGSWFPARTSGPGPPGPGLPVGDRRQLPCRRSPENPRPPGTRTEMVLIRAESREARRRDDILMRLNEAVC